jgi:cation:H+ antiporter
MMLTDGSVALAERLRVPQFIVGLTVVAVGTSMPELTISVISAIGGHTDMAIGNVVGSNIFNTFLILGVCALFSPIIFTKTNIRRDIPICIMSAVALLVVTLFNHDITRIEGLLLLLGYVAMILYTIRDDRKKILESGAKISDEEPTQKMPLWRVPIWIVLGLAGLIYGGDLFVSSATAIAKSLGVSEAVIAITLVAGGTSMPELITCVIAAAKKKGQLALGNVIGSNISNVFLILGTCATVSPLQLGNILPIDLVILSAASLLVAITAFTFRRNELDRAEGAIFMILYIVYVLYLLMR